MEHCFIGVIGIHNNSLELFKKYGLPHIQHGGAVLEVGPDWSVPGGRVRPLLSEVVDGYHFTDIEPRNSDQPGYVSMFGEYSIGVPNDTFDAIVSLNVIEHVRKIWTWVTELTRVLKPSGLVILVNPVSWPYHPSPYDCWRILPDGYKALFDEIGLEHVFSFSGGVAPLEGYLRNEHGPHDVTDTIAIGRKNE